MLKVKSCFNTCFHNFRKWSCNYRIYLLFILILMFCYEYIRPFSTLGKEMDETLPPVLLPFLTSSTMTQIMLMFGIVFLFCDAPFMDASQPYFLIRSGRNRWMIGQILYIMAASAIYLLTIQLFSMIMLLPQISFTDNWGSLLFTLSQGSLSEGLIKISIPYKILLLYTPSEAFFLSFVLEWCAFVFIGLCMFIINLHCNRIWGVVGAGIIIFFDAMVYNTLPYRYNKISPVSLARLTVLDSSGATENPSVLYAFLFYGVGILLLSVLCILTFRRKPLQTQISI